MNEPIHNITSAQAIEEARAVHREANSIVTRSSHSAHCKTIPYEQAIKSLLEEYEPQVRDHIRLKLKALRP